MDLKSTVDWTEYIKYYMIDMNTIILKNYTNITNIY